MLAGLPPIIGLYSSLIPPILYSLLGTSRQLSVGPVAMDSLLVAVSVGAIAQSGSKDYLGAAIVLALMVGVFQFLMGVLRMGFLVNFLSQPVVSGFTSAAALIIGLSQFTHLLGVPIKNSSNVVGLVQQTIKAAPSTSVATLSIGVAAIVSLLTLKKFAPRAPGALLVVVAGTLVVYFLGLEGAVAVVGEVPPGLPHFQLPAVNQELLTTLLPSALTISLVAFMESISVSQAYARKNKYSVAPNQELIAVGAANFFGSFFQSYPVTGGFSRTAVNATAGAKTNVAALITAALVGIALLFLTPLFYFLPKAVLAAIITTAVLGLVDFAEVQRLERVKKADLVLLVGTFLATLGLGIVSGIALGVGGSLAWFVFKTTRPHIAVLGRVPGTTHFRNVHRNQSLTTYRGVIAVRMDAQFYFGNVAFLKSTLARLEAEMEEELRAVILDASAINNLDSSGESALHDMSEAYEARGVELYITGVKGPVRDVLESSGLAETMGIRCRYLNVHEAILAYGPEPHKANQHSSSDSTSETKVRAANASARL
jgi:SulP family sulfate permease